MYTYGMYTYVYIYNTRPKLLAGPFKSIHIYICIYACKQIHIYIYIYIYTRTYIFKNIYIHIYVYVYIYIHIHVCSFIYVCIYIYTYIYRYYWNTSVRTHAHAHTHTYTYTCARTHERAGDQVQGATRGRGHTNSRVCTGLPALSIASGGVCRHVYTSVRGCVCVSIERGRGDTSCECAQASLHYGLRQVVYVDMCIHLCVGVCERV